MISAFKGWNFSKSRNSMVPLVKVHFQRDRSRRAKSLASSSWRKAMPSNDGVNIDMYIIYT